MVVVLLVASSREPVAELGILKRCLDEEVFYRRESCPLENFYVSHVVLLSDLHD